MRTRNEFPQLLRGLGLIGYAAEIGVAEGGFSYHLLDHWPGRCHQIDPWQILKEPGFSGHGEDTDDGMEKRFKAIVQNSITKYLGRAFPMRSTSDQAAHRFPNEYFDFVYIDANHSYESAKQDIALWHPKVKPGGILAGHDYLDGVFHGQKYGVKRAVDIFALKYGFEVNVTEETDWPSWWIINCSKCGGLGRAAVLTDGKTFKRRSIEPCPVCKL